MAVFRPGTNKSSVNNFPSIRPTLDLDFANSKTLDPRITYTRASGASYVGVDGLIKYAGVNEPRFDHDPMTGESLGLLIEESRQNLLQRSEEFNDAYWIKINSARVDANVVTAPDGNSTADKFIENTNTNHKILARSFTAIANNTYTFSVFVKAAERTSIMIHVRKSDYSTRFGASFNLRTQVVTPDPNTVGGTLNNTSIERYPNDWYRISVSGNIGNNTDGVVTMYLIGSGGAFDIGYTGNGSSGIYLWGSQLEVGSFPTSYIPTVGSTRTRAADDARITGSNFSSWYRQDEGSYFTISRSNYGTHPPGTRAGVFYSSSGSTVNYISLAKNSNSSTYSSYIQSNDLIQTTVVSNSTISLQKFKAAFRYSFNNFAVSYDGIPPLVDITVITPTTLDRLWIGRGIDGGWWYNGTISRLTYFPKRLPDQQLQALTR
jgi:hypothetical protein